MILKRILVVILFNVVFSFQARAITFSARVPPAVQSQMLSDLHFVEQIQLLVMTMT